MLAWVLPLPHAPRALAQGVPLLVSLWSVAQSLLEIRHRAGVRPARVPCHSAVW
jgi:hypothetical protein